MFFIFVSVAAIEMKLETRGCLEVIKRQGSECLNWVGDRGKISIPVEPILM